MRSAVLICAATVAACSRGGGQPQAERMLVESDRIERSRAAEAPFASRPSASDPVVAVVGDVPILASEVAAQARARGLTPRAATEELVTRELLAAEARRRGLETDREVSEARKPPLVEALIKRDFEAHYRTPADIPLDEVKLAYQKNLLHYVADEERDVFFMRARSEKTYSAEDKAKALEAVTALRKKFPDHGVDCDVMKAAAQASAIGLPAMQVSDYNGFKVYTDPTFGDAMFAIAKPGDVTTTPLVTRWGTDYICLRKITPPRNRSFAEAEPELREHFFDLARGAGFQRFADRVMREHDVRAPDAKRRDALVRRAFNLPSADAPTSAQPGPGTSRP